MKIYIIRHGQVCPKDFYGSTDYPAGDMPLSDVGKEQALRLAKEMKKRNFDGSIYSSPYRRTLMTADAVAKECEVKIYPEPSIREKFFSDESAINHIGMSIDKINEEFGTIASDASLIYPWWGKTLETDEMIVSRTEKFWEKVLNSNQDEILAVGHGATVMGSFAYFNNRYNLGLPKDLSELSAYMLQRMHNCFISYFEIDGHKNLISAQLYYGEHLCDELITSNANQKPRPEMIII